MFWEASLTLIMPDYDDYQSSFHTAFAPELAQLVAMLPRTGRVIDVPCGRGFYTRLLARHLQTGTLTAVDACEDSLPPLRAALADATTESAVLKADAYHLPFADAAFDTLWCAESLISLEPPRALREFIRVLAPGGIAAVLEVDEFHHVLLPWPVELEAALPRALLKATRQKHGSGIKHSPARRLRAWLNEAGFRAVRRRLLPLERVTPFDEPTQAFLRHHLEYLRSFARPHLSEAHQTLFDRAADPEAAASIVRKTDVELTLMLALYHARKPA